MGTAAGMLDAMRALIGLAEVPPGSNHNKVTVWYGFDSPWCDMTLAYAANESGNLEVVGRFAWTPSHAEWFRARGRWHYGLGGARPGDIVFFDWSGTRLIGNIDHVGVVEAVRADGTIVSIEGNSGDICARRVRGAATVVGWGRPTYADAAPMPGTDGILRIGSTGVAVANLQTALNTALGKHLAVDGVFGADTRDALRVLQARAQLEVDAEFGPASAAMLKAALAGSAVLIKPIAVAPKPAPLTVDGAFGPATCGALQRHLNARGERLGVDGVFGLATKRALQRWLGVTADGVIGPATVRALQRRVGAPVDGIWGPDTTRHLQRVLNAGTGT